METIIKLLPQLEEYVKWKEKVLLVSVWHNDGSNVSILEKKTLKIYHVLEDLNYGILRMYTEFWKNFRQKVLVGCQKNFVRENISYIARSIHLENHTEAVNLYLMN